MYYRVRAEIIGEFVNCENFNNYEEAWKHYEKLHDQFIYDTVDIVEIEN